MEVREMKKEFDYVIAIGASTGGKDSVCKILRKLPEDFPPILLVQHMSPVFTQTYVKYMKKNCKLKVIESKDGDEVKKGQVLVATGEHQMRLVERGGRYFVSCREEGSHNGNCPSVDVLFKSMADILKDKAIGVILTGIGTDGCESLLDMKKAGAYTIGQDEESSLVYGMPKIAFEMGAVLKQVKLENIPDELINYLKKAN